MSDRQWSTQQQDIFQWFADGRGNLVVRARAGTGKTTTILEAVGRAPERNVLLAAFNKRIADDLTVKLSAPNAQAKTLHSVGFAVIRQFWQGTRVEAGRAGRLAQLAAGQDAPDPIVALVRRLSGYGKNMLPIAALDTTPFSARVMDEKTTRLQEVASNRGIEQLIDVAEAFDCTPDEDWEDAGWTARSIARCAQRAMQEALHRDGEIDFDDMIFIPLASKWVRPCFDMVVVDEAQDMNAAQILLAQKSCRGRIAVVGDDRQAIYGFRGADSSSLDRLKRELQAVERPLTITYRCPRAVVAIAAGMVPDYVAAPSAPEGLVRPAKHPEITAAAKAGDFVLSRANAPLMGVCLSLLRAGKRAKIEGKDVGRRLVAIVRKFKARSMPELLEKLDRWLAREIARANKTPKYAESKIEKAEDEAETIRGLADGLSGPRELEARIEALFADTNGAPDAVVCSTVHRAKGLESDCVFLLTDTLYPRKRTDIEEKNIHYVAVTRSKRELVLVTGTPGAKKGGGAPQRALALDLAPRGDAAMDAEARALDEAFEKDDGVA